jgi:hypothetical protein
MIQPDSAGNTNRRQGDPRYISICVGYPWTKDENLNPVPIRNDPRWRSIRDLTKKAADAAKKIADKTIQAPMKFDARITRLRGAHGQILLQNLINRIHAADIVVMDIGSTDGDGFNSNVLIELGVALAFDSIANKPAFILKPEGHKHPTDLAGFLFTEYRSPSGSGEIKLVDELGFHAALRSKILSLAADRHMIGARKTSSTEVEDDETEGPQVTPTSNGRHK